ncbi:hypothetical protein ABZ914_17970 [Spirillospora sp. NPDC046719]
MRIGEWDEQVNRVTWQFSDWLSVNRDIETFLRQSLAWSKEAYDAMEEEARNIAASNPRSPSPIFGVVGPYLNAMETLVQGLWREDYRWMLYAAVVKDMVTNFEIYLEKSLDAAVETRRLVPLRQGSWASPSWRTIVKGHALLGNSVETPRVIHIRQLRHVLTHQRGELRTRESRAQFAYPDPSPPNAFGTEDEESLWLHENPIAKEVELTAETVQSISEVLGGVVRKVDVRIWQITRQKVEVPEIDRIRSELDKARE